MLTATSRAFKPRARQHHQVLIWTTSTNYASRSIAAHANAMPKETPTQKQLRIKLGSAKR